METTQNRLWTVQDFAQYLRITTGAARAMLRRDQVPQHAIRRIGRRIRLVGAAVRDWVEKSTP